MSSGVAVDDRGSVSFVNKPDLEGFKRFYVVENFSTDTVRAFHGHIKESKGVVVVKGSILLVTAPMLDGRPDKPSRFVLSDKSPHMQRIPAGYANGFRALEPGTRVMFFSTTTIEEAAGDDYRFPYDCFGKKIWETESR